MKNISRTVWMSIALAGALGLSACGGDDKKETLTPTPVDTAHILRKAQNPVDNQDPAEVNDGKVTFSDVSDTTDPIEVSGS